ncbi:MAG: hypothetical protein OXL41_06055 [Nitrospinae bacterium]|nr:hypothetical protein [Nitrospinota bacterium]
MAVPSFLVGTDSSGAPFDTPPPAATQGEEKGVCGLGAAQGEEKVWRRDEENKQPPHPE